MTDPTTPSPPAIAAADLTLLRRTRDAFDRTPDRAAAAFYRVLFREAPGLRPMFPHEMGDQGRKLSATISAAIMAANDLPSLTPVLAELARRHVAYGVIPGHYDVVGRALLAALEDDLEASPAELAAWARVYAALAGLMVAAAYPEPPSASASVAKL